MEPPAFDTGPAGTVRAAPGSSACLLLPLPTGTPPFLYTWNRAGAALDDRFTSSEDAAGVRLTVSAARTGDSGVYTLQASNAAGSDTSRVRLEVAAEEIPTGEDPPTFLRRLQDLTVKVGTRTRFLVEIVSSTECKVTWYRNERRLLEAERVSLARDGNFWCADVGAVSVDDAGRWTCTAENDGGRASCSAHLNVLVPKAYKRPEFVEELRALLTEQGTVSLECKVVGVPTPVLRWFKDSREIKAGDVFALTANADDPTSLGTYTCEAVNCMGRAYSSSKVHVVGRASRETSLKPSSSDVSPEPPPIFTKELEDYSIKISDPLTLSCHVVVPPWPRSVVWYNKEGKVEPGERYHALEDGVGGYLLEVSSAEWADEGEWKCVATSTGGRVGISTCYVAMEVPKNYRKPRFMENLQAILTEEGLVSFECKVVGFPTPVLSWFKDGQELKPGDVYQLTGTNSLGSYCCIAKNCMGQASSSAELTVEDIQNQLNEEEKLQLFSKNQAPKFIQGLKSVEAKIDEPFRFTVKVGVPPEPSVVWYRDEQPVDESTRCHLGQEERGVFYLHIQTLEFLDQAEWKCVSLNDFGHSVTSCFLKLIIPRHYKKPRFLENLQAILSEEGAVNLECKVIGVPQPVLKWYKDGEELKPGDIHRIISGQDGTCCLGTYTCEAQNCMGIAASSASLLGFEDSMKAKAKKAEEHTLQRNLSLSTIHEERTSQMYDTPVGDITLDDKGEISFSFDGKEVSVSLYETPDLTEEEALQIVEMYADQLSENVTEHNVVELPPLRFVKETSTSGNLLMEAIIIDVSPDYFASPDEDLRTEADVEDISIADENGPPLLSLDQDVEIVGEDYLEKTMAMLSDQKSDIPAKLSRKKSDSQKSIDDFYSLSRDLSLSEEKGDDDTHMSESDLNSYESAKSSAKIKSKLSTANGQKSSEPTKTIVHKDETVLMPKQDPFEKPEARKQPQQILEVPVAVKPKRERRTSRSSRRSSSGSEKSISKSKEELLRLKAEIEQLPVKPTMSGDEFVVIMSSISDTLSKVINDVQLIERDIILKSELMSSAATASRSLEIISTLISPLSEIHSIADAAKESVNESKEITSTIFNSLPQPLKALHQSLTITEKCIDMESDNKTLVKKTCVAFIETCGAAVQKVISKVTLVVASDYLQIENKIINEIDSLASEISSVIKFSADTIHARNLLSEASEIKPEVPSQEENHARNTQKAVFELKSPVYSLLAIIENAEKGNVTELIKTPKSEVLLNDMSAPIQDLQIALEQVESLSISESNSDLQKYNTNIIEAVVDPILKLRCAFEQLSTENISQENADMLKQILSSIKQNLNEIFSQINSTETRVGKFDVLQSDNKINVLQKMAQCLITLENNLTRLDSMPEIQTHMNAFHKKLTKVLEVVIESNDAEKYFAIMEICNAVDRINTSIKLVDPENSMPLASLSNTLRIIDDSFLKSVFDSELNCSIVASITDVLFGIQEAINKSEELTLQIESEHIQDFITSDYTAAKATVVMEHIDNTIAAIDSIKTIETTQELKLTLSPALESICPILEELKNRVAIIQQSETQQSEKLSDLSNTSIAQTLANPLCELNQNIIVLNQLLFENIESLKLNTDVISAVAEPLHELHTTLEILQQDVISQYEDDMTPYEVNVNMASAVQNINSCIVMIQEQTGLEAADDISTLEDISNIKTSADVLPSDRLVLPTAEETEIEQSLPPLITTLPVSVTARALQSLNDHLTVLQTPEVVDALDTLSEISDFSSLKSVVLGMEDLHNGIESILHPLTMEASGDLGVTNNLRNLAVIAQPLQELHHSLSILDTTDIPIHENVIDLSTDKVHSVISSIFEFKEHLDKCNQALLPAVDILSNTFEISTTVINLINVCSNLKDIIEKAKSNCDDIVVHRIEEIEEVIETLLQVTDVSKGIKVDQIKFITEKLFEKVVGIQEELLHFTSQPSTKLAQEAKLIEIVEEVENNIVVLQQYDFVELLQVSDMSSCLSSHMAMEIESESLALMAHIAENAVNVVQDCNRETPVPDMMIVEDFLKTCKSEITILKCLINKATTHKKIIRLLEEFNALQTLIIDFKCKSSQLKLSDDTSGCLATFLVHADDCIENIRNSLVIIIQSQSEMLFKKPIAKLLAIEKLQEMPQFSKDPIVFAVIDKLHNIFVMIQPLIINIENDITQDLKQLKIITTTREENLVTEKIVDLTEFVEFQSKLTKTGTHTEHVLNKVSLCVDKHQEFRDVAGNAKLLIILKCLSECVDILEEKNIEISQESQVITGETDANILKQVLTEMLQPLQALQNQLENIRAKIISGVEEDSISQDFNNTESLVQTMAELHNNIVQQIGSDKNAAHNENIALIIQVDEAIHTIQDSVKSVENVEAAQAVIKITEPMNDIDQSLQKVLNSELKTQETKHARSKDINSNIESLKSALERYINIENDILRVSKIINIDIYESIPLAADLKDVLTLARVKPNDFKILEKKHEKFYCRKKTAELLQHIEQYIDLIEIVEEISAVIKIENVEETIDIARELKESISASQNTIESDIRDQIYTDQTRLALKLQKALSALQVQVLDSAQELAPALSIEVLQRIARVTAQLQADLVAVTGLQVPIQAPLEILETVTSVNNITDTPTIEIETLQIVVAEKVESTVLDQIENIDKTVTKMEYPGVSSEIGNILEADTIPAISVENVVSFDNEEKENNLIYVESTVLQPENVCRIVEELETDQEVVSKIDKPHFETELTSSGITSEEIMSSKAELNTLDEDNVRERVISPTQEIKSICLDGKEKLVEDIKDFISSKAVIELTSLVDVEQLKSGIEIAQELLRTIPSMETLTQPDLEVPLHQAILVVKLKNAISVLHQHDTEILQELTSKESLDKVTEIVNNLYLDLSEMINSHPNINEANLLMLAETEDENLSKQKNKQASSRVTEKDNSADGLKLDSKSEHETFGQTEKILSSEDTNDVEKSSESIPAIIEIATAFTEDKENIGLDTESLVDANIILTSVIVIETASTEADEFEILESSESQSVKIIENVTTHTEPDEHEQVLRSENEIQFIIDQEDSVHQEEQAILKDVASIGDALNDSLEKVTVPNEVITLSAESAVKQSETVKVSTEQNKLVEHIEEFVAEDISEIILEISKLTNIDDLKESVTIAKELRDCILSIDYSFATEETSSLTSKNHEAEVKLTKQLQNALFTLHTQALESAKSITTLIKPELLQKVSEIITQLQEDLITADKLNHNKVVQGVDLREESKKDTIDHLFTLLQDVNNIVNDYSSSTNVENTETLKDTLDEVQTVIIKLKRDYDQALNNTLCETLDDLECSVRSVQLQINEESPPELLKEACETLQQIANNMTTVQDLDELKNISTCVPTQTILNNCSDDSNKTLKLLESASELESNDNSNLSNIISKLRGLSNCLKSLRMSFLSDADTLIENGIDVIRYLDTMEDQVFDLDRQVEMEQALSPNARDSIITAIHSVYGSISNMRGTISSVQKRYMFENYGQPSESLLRSIKNIAYIIAVNEDLNKSDWKNFSKCIRNVLSHFEDIKFYINLDKTARIPSDSTFTKFILDELKTNITNIVMSQELSSSINIMEIGSKALQCINKNLHKIEDQTSLEVKCKIPIFKDIGLEMFCFTNVVKDALQQSSQIVEKQQETHDTQQTKDINIIEFDSKKDISHSLVLGTSINNQDNVMVYINQLENDNLLNLIPQETEALIELPEICNKQFPIENFESKLDEYEDDRTENAKLVTIISCLVNQELSDISTPTTSNTESISNIDLQKNSGSVIAQEASTKETLGPEDSENIETFREIQSIQNEETVEAEIKLKEDDKTKDAKLKQQIDIKEEPQSVYELKQENVVNLFGEVALKLQKEDIDSLAERQSQIVQKSKEVVLPQNLTEIATKESNDINLTQNNDDKTETTIDKEVFRDENKKNERTAASDKQEIKTSVNLLENEESTSTQVEEETKMTLTKKNEDEEANIPKKKDKYIDNVEETKNQSAQTLTENVNIKNIQVLTENKSTENEKVTAKEEIHQCLIKHEKDQNKAENIPEKQQQTETEVPKKPILKQKSAEDENQITEAGKAKNKEIETKKISKKLAEVDKQTAEKAKEVLEIEQREKEIETTSTNEKPEANKLYNKAELRHDIEEEVKNKEEDKKDEQKNIDAKTEDELMQTTKEKRKIASAEEQNNISEEAQEKALLKQNKEETTSRDTVYENQTDEMAKMEVLVEHNMEIIKKATTQETQKECEKEQKIASEAINEEKAKTTKAAIEKKEQVAKAENLEVESAKKEAELKLRETKVVTTEKKQDSENANRETMLTQKIQEEKQLPKADIQVAEKVKKETELKQKELTFKKTVAEANKEDKNRKTESKLGHEEQEAPEENIQEVEKEYVLRQKEVTAKEYKMAEIEDDLTQKDIEANTATEKGKLNVEETNTETVVIKEEKIIDAATEEKNVAENTKREAKLKQIEGKTKEAFDEKNIKAKTAKNDAENASRREKQKDAKDTPETVAKQKIDSYEIKAVVVKEKDEKSNTKMETAGEKQEIEKAKTETEIKQEEQKATELKGEAKKAHKGYEIKNKKSAAKENEKTMNEDELKQEEHESIKAANEEKQTAEQNQKEAISTSKEENQEAELKQTEETNNAATEKTQRTMTVKTEAELKHKKQETKNAIEKEKLEEVNAKVESEFKKKEQREKKNVNKEKHEAEKVKKETELHQKEERVEKVFEEENKEAEEKQRKAKLKEQEEKKAAYEEKQEAKNAKNSAELKQKEQEAKKSINNENLEAERAPKETKSKQKEEEANNTIEDGNLDDEKAKKEAELKLKEKDASKKAFIEEKHGAKEEKREIKVIDKKEEEKKASDEKKQEATNAKKEAELNQKEQEVKNAIKDENLEAERAPKKTASKQKEKKAQNTIKEEKLEDEKAKKEPEISLKEEEEAKKAFSKEKQEAKEENRKAKLIDKKQVIKTATDEEKQEAKNATKEVKLKQVEDTKKSAQKEIEQNKTLKKEADLIQKEQDSKNTIEEENLEAEKAKKEAELKKKQEKIQKETELKLTEEAKKEADEEETEKYKTPRKEKELKQKEQDLQTTSKNVFKDENLEAEKANKVFEEEKREVECAKKEIKLKHTEETIELVADETEKTKTLKEESEVKQKEQESKNTIEEKKLDAEKAKKEPGLQQREDEEKKALDEGNQAAKHAKKEVDSKQIEETKKSDKEDTKMTKTENKEDEVKQKEQKTKCAIEKNKLDVEKAKKEDNLQQKKEAKKAFTEEKQEANEEKTKVKLKDEKQEEKKAVDEENQEAKNAKKKYNLKQVEETKKSAEEETKMTKTLKKEAELKLREQEAKNTIKEEKLEAGKTKNELELKQKEENTKKDEEAKKAFKKEKQEAERAKPEAQLKQMEEIKTAAKEESEKTKTLKKEAELKQKEQDSKNAIKDENLETEKVNKKAELELKEEEAKKALTEHNQEAKEEKIKANFKDIKQEVNKAADEKKQETKNTRKEMELKQTEETKNAAAEETKKSITANKEDELKHKEQETKCAIEEEKPKTEKAKNEAELEQKEQKGKKEVKVEGREAENTKKEVHIKQEEKQANKSFEQEKQEAESAKKVTELKLSEETKKTFAEETKIANKEDVLKEQEAKNFTEKEKLRAEKAKKEAELKQKEHEAKNAMKEEKLEGDKAKKEAELKRKEQKEKKEVEKERLEVEKTKKEAELKEKEEEAKKAKLKVKAQEEEKTADERNEKTENANKGCELKHLEGTKKADEKTKTAKKEVISKQKEEEKAKKTLKEEKKESNQVIKEAKIELKEGDKQLTEKTKSKDQLIYEEKQEKLLKETNREKNKTEIANDAATKKKTVLKQNVEEKKDAKTDHLLNEEIIAANITRKEEEPAKKMIESDLKQERKEVEIRAQKLKYDIDKKTECVQNLLNKKDDPYKSNGGKLRETNKNWDLCYQSTPKGSSHTESSQLMLSDPDQHYIKEYQYEPSVTRISKYTKEKPIFVDHNHKDYAMEFARPANYRERSFDIFDRSSEKQSIHDFGNNVTIYKAQTIIRDAQLRSSASPYPEISRSGEPGYRKPDIRHRSKALSEVRSVVSEKGSISRDSKKKPVFSTYLTDRTAVESSRVKLTCSILSSIDPSITWYRNGVLLDNKLKYKTKCVDGLITLEVLNAATSDSAEYTCSVENENGSVSSSATLKVYPSFEASPIPPTFTRSIRDMYHMAENELVLECRIRGQPLPTITWLKDDKPIVSDERFQAYYLADGVCRLTIESPTPDDSGKYTCKAENSVWSDQITHVVTFTGKERRLSPNITTIEKSRFNRQSMESRRPHFTNVLSDYKVAKGGTIGLQVEIRGAPTNVEWLREGRCITEVYMNAKTYVEQGLYTLALTDVTEKESGMYTCRAWSTHGNVDMNAAITVVQPNELEGRPAIIVGRPDKDILISVGEDVNISFRVQGEPKPKVIFMKGIRDITTSQRVCKMTSDDYVKFTLKRSVISDAGTYCILVRNAYGCDRAFVTVVVRQRASSDNLISDWTYPADEASVSTTDRNYKSVPERIPGEPTIVDGGSNWVSLSWPKPEPGVTAPVLAFRVDSWLLGKEGGARWVELGITPLNSFDAFNLKQGEEYHFRVTPRNRYGWGESVQTSRPVSIGLAGDRPEFIDILPGQLKALAGETANLNCSVKGKPTPEVIWMKNGHELEEDNGRVSITYNGFHCGLTIKDISIEDEARYSCEATNDHGRTSTYARLAVVTDRMIWEADAKLKRERSAGTEGEFPPQFTMRLRDRRVQATYPVRLTCQVVGSPPPTLTWYKDGQEVESDSRRCQSQDEHFHTLEIAPTALEDGGVYEALARNSRGAVSCRCSLIVDKGIRAYVAPEFCCGLEPLYRVNDGEELRISAVVEAYPSVGVTWYRDGVRLRPSRRAVMTLDHDGQIELALAAVTPRDAGVYTCTASNEVGRASTSGKVEIIGGDTDTKNPPLVLLSPDAPYSKEPMFIRKPRSSSAQEGDTVIIQCEVVGDPKPDVYWLRDFLKPDYYRDSSHFRRVGLGSEYRFEIPHAKLDYTGAYSVVARNAHGEAKAVISLQILAKDLTCNEDVHYVRYGEVEVLPRFEKELTDLLSCDGDAVEFECRVSGHPVPDIKWFHYDELIRECEDFEWTFKDGSARLKIRQVTAEDEGTYSCEAANTLGKAASSACLVVYPAGEPNTLCQRLRRPPELLSAVSTPRSTPRTTPARSLSRARTPGPDSRRLCSPARQMAPAFYTYPFNKVAEEGDTVTLQCAVKGLPAPWATWDKDGVIITPSSRITLKEKDEIFRILELEQVTVDDVGVYRITVENEFGRAEASARIEVITQRGKFYGGVRAYSPSPRRSLTYRSRRPSTPSQD